MTSTEVRALEIGQFIEFLSPTTNGTHRAVRKIRDVRPAMGCPLHTVVEVCYNGYDDFVVMQHEIIQVVERPTRAKK